MRFTRLLLAALFLSACNLNNQPATPTSPATALPATAAVPTSLPLPGGRATPATIPLDITRTPFGSSPPTLQSQPGLVATSGFPTPATGERAEITSPAFGASVSAPNLIVSGVVHNLPEDQITLQVFDDRGEAISIAQPVPLSNPNNVADVPWTASLMIRAYTGVAQIRITARTGSGSDEVIAAVNVNVVQANTTSIAPPATGLNGSSISSPANGSTVTVSNNSLSVTGTAGGLPDNQFTLLLLDSRETVLNSVLITTTGAEQHAVPWAASLGTSGYRGSAIIRAVSVQNGQQITLVSINVTLQ